MVDELIAERRVEEYRENIQDGLRKMAGKSDFRRVAAITYIRLTGFWGLTVREAATLLDVSEREYRDWQSGDFSSIDAVCLEKISCLMGIYKSLFTLYSGHVDRVNAWLRKQNNGELYGGKPPYDILAEESANVFHLVRRDVAAWTV